MKADVSQQVGALISVNTTSKKVKYGTGVLISPNLVLTAAHNVFDMKAR
jgi:V8-like Glu-specific endopeptidase